MQALKLSKWNIFFVDAYKLFQTNVPESPEFFASVAGQILDRVVRHIPISKPITQESMGLLREYLEELSKNHSKTGTGVKHEEVLEGLAAMVNFGSAPGPFPNCSFYIFNPSQVE